MKSDTLIRFGWEAMLATYNYDCKKSLQYLYRVTTGISPPPTLKKNIDCWLSKPIDFLMSGATDNQKCIYLHLATKRNWLDYKEHGITYVPNYIVEDLYVLATLDTNPLLQINDENVDLKY